AQDLTRCVRSPGEIEAGQRSLSGDVLDLSGRSHLPSSPTAGCPSVAFTRQSPHSLLHSLPASLTPHSLPPSRRDHAGGGALAPEERSSGAAGRSPSKSSLPATGKTICAG